METYTINLHANVPTILIQKFICKLSMHMCKVMFSCYMNDTESKWDGSTKATDVVYSAAQRYILRGPKYMKYMFSTLIISSKYMKIKKILVL